jgi:SET domain-containing protein
MKDNYWIDLIPQNMGFRDDFIIEYCGEVISESQFQKRKKEYHRAGISHFYFMSLKSNEVRVSNLDKYSLIV